MSVDTLIKHSKKDVKIIDGRGHKLFALPLGPVNGSNYIPMILHCKKNLNKSQFINLPVLVLIHDLRWFYKNYLDLDRTGLKPV